ncbi:MAG: sugar transferase [Bryobacterales bacterium]|nr:sugar transferase [Bryobacteraceae bacterium]MDW8130978.1 sugar transferase [Bryobacterales bacterium]
MFSRHRRKVRFLYALTDVVLAALAFEAAYQTRLALPLERIFYFTLPVKVLLLGFSVLAWVGVGLWLGIYDKLEAGRPAIIVRDALRQSGWAAAAVILFQYLLRLDVSRPFLALLAVYGWLLLCLFRLAAARTIPVLRRRFEPSHYVLVVGTGEKARRLGEALEASEPYGIRLLGFVAVNGDPDAGSLRLRREYPVHRAAELPALLRRQVVDDVIFAVEASRLGELEDLLAECDEQGVRTRVLADFFPHGRSEMYLERLGTLPLLTFSAAPHDEILLLVKRAMDVVVAAVALLLLAPLMLAVGALVRLTSPGPAIFRQVRCGLNGRRFVLYKFRSMCVNAEALKPRLEHLSRKQVAFKIPNDPRVTRLGRWLRKFSIDEWPQLWNVLKGDMSLVGPRPAVPEEVEKYKGWQRRRLRMRPGLTCLWALEGRDHLDFDTWMRLDLEYIDNWSLGLDLKILLRTIPQVLTGKGAY